MMARLFGTDGVRGVANRELTPEMAFRLGRAGTAVLLRRSGWDGHGGERPRMLVGRDTRLSGEMLEAALVAGITSVGADALLLGVIPTPAVAYLTRTLGVEAGVMISASHNPVPDNGIKFFSAQGYKLSDEIEDEIEGEIRKDDGLPRPTGTGIGRIRTVEDGLDRYTSFILSTTGVSLQRMHVVLDCACGAAWAAAPRVFRELGARVTVINGEPDGSRINVNCGSTHPEMLQRKVREVGADLGLANDGDADRVMAVDEKGQVVDGDHIMAVCGLDLLSRGQLPGRSIAVTVYSNLGLHQALRQAGGDVVVTKNGDRYVLEAMREQDLALGGEQSGHIIFLRHNTTGDGILTGVQLVSVLKRTGRTLSQAAGVMQTFPQYMINVRVKDKAGWEGNQTIAEAVSAAEAALGKEGRILVRPSGTEPVIRVMGEGPREETVKEVVEEAAKIIQQELN